MGLKASDDQPSSSASSIDELPSCESRSRSHVGKMTFYCARPNAGEGSRFYNGPAAGDERGENVHLAIRWLSWESAAEVSVPHACRLAAASHSSRPSIGMV